MKRISATHWLEIFNHEESKVIQAALLFGDRARGERTEGDLTERGIVESDITERESISSVLEHIQVDYQTISAAILLVGLKNKAFEIELLEDQFEKGIISLVHEADSLFREEATWLKKFDGEFSESDVSAYHMMLLGILHDARVVLIVLAMQMIRMQRLSSESRQVQIEVAKETRFIFAPLANRLGIGQLKWELEDLAFRFMQPDDYKQIATYLEERRVDREQYMELLVELLTNALQATNIQAEVNGRPKHLYSIWRKMQKKNLAFSDLYDVRAMRVMVPDIASCYSALSVVHGLWDFIPSEYDDYIAAPKANNYQSLHTAVCGPNKKTVEIQFRTAEMHEHAELGVAAHWRYKDGSKQNSVLEKQIEELRQVLSDDSKQAEPLPVKSHSRIYVLSPKGNVVELPAGGTPLDFAYYIHTDIGNKCRGAKVNDKMVPLTTQLKSGQTVEIITAKNATPSRDWLVQHLGYLQSSRSRAKVKQWFKREYRDEDIATGKLALTKTANGLPEQSILTTLTENFDFFHVDDLFAAIGRGDLGVVQILNSIKKPVDESKVETVHLSKPLSSASGSNEFVIQGVGELLTSLARCCKPMAGDEVEGYITKGRGITIHCQDCNNLRALKERSEKRIISVNWGQNVNHVYEVDIEVHALDRSGLLRDVSAVLSGDHVSVLSMNSYTDKKLQEARMRLTIELRNTDMLPGVLARLVNIRGVFDAMRVK